MTEILILLGLGTLKVVILLAAAAALAQVLSQRPARLRAVVWATALAGALLMPIAAPLLPKMVLPLPAVFDTAKPAASLIDRHPGKTAVASTGGAPSHSGSESLRSNTDVTGGGSIITWATAALTLWVVGTAVLLIHLGIGLHRVRRTLNSAAPLIDREWTALLDLAIIRTDCRRSVRLLASPGIEVPATVGVFKPCVLIPSYGKNWNEDRRLAVLLHELVHVRRLDWAVRLLARIAKAVYWFIPLTWWAVRRLDLEQELACDEEVVALGTPPAAYADHLLAIARSAVLNPAPAISGMAMARTLDLEKRIMTLLKNTSHRRVGIAVLIPAVILVAAMVSALAAVSPSATEVTHSSSSEKPVDANSEIAALMAEMEAAEIELESHLEGVEVRASEIERHIEAIGPIEIDEEAIARIEEAMEPHLERIKEIEIDMAPFEAEMEKFEKRFEELELHIEDGTLEEVQRQIDEQLQENLEMMELSHEAMEPHLMQLEQVHLEMEEFHKQMELIHLEMEPHHEALEEMHRELEPLHEDLERLHEEMEPLHQQMEEIGAKLEGAIADEVAGVLKSRLGAVTGLEAPFWEAARRIVDSARVQVRKQVISVQSPFNESREVLQDLLVSHRIGTKEAFDSAIAATASDLENLEIRVQ